MDVGNPSNFERLQDFYNNDAASMHDAINAVTIKDASILEEIRLTYERTGQIIDPHTAVGTAAVRKRADLQRPFIITATAHPAKFPEVIKAALNIDITLPDSLARLMSLPKQSVLIPANYQTLLTVINQHN
jgi:threonine synthase